MYHVPPIRRVAENNLLVPMLDNSVCRVNYRSVHIEENPGKVVGFWPAREGWVPLRQRHLNERM